MADAAARGFGVGAADLVESDEVQVSEDEEEEDEVASALSSDEVAESRSTTRQR